MKKQYQLFIIFILLFSSCKLAYKISGKEADLKPWCSDSYRRISYPDTRFYVLYKGNLSCDKKKYIESTLNTSISKMKEELAANIVTDIKTENRSNKSQITTNTGRTETIIYDFKSLQSTFMNLTDIHSDYSYDHINKELHVLLYIEKKELANSYISIITDDIKSAQVLATSVRNEITEEKSNSKFFNESLSQLSSRKKKIDQNKSVLSSLIKNDRAYTDQLEVIDINYESLMTDINFLLSNYVNSYIEDLLKSANTLYVKEKKYFEAYNKYNDVLILNPYNEEAKNNQQQCLDEIAKEKNRKIDEYERLGDFESALNEINFLSNLDNEFYLKYKSKEKELSEKYFKKSISEIEKLLEFKNNYDLAYSKYIKLEPYSYIDIKKYNNIGKELEENKVTGELKKIDEKIYNKQYETAVTMISDFRKDFPYNEKIYDKLNEVSFKLYKIEKKKKLDKTFTRNVFEFNFSLANRPNQFADGKSFGLENKAVLFDDVFSFYQFGIYRKFNVKEKMISRNGHSRFRYSQAGIRMGFLNPSSGIYDLQSDTINLVQPKLTTVCASLISRRFLMVNLGVAFTQDSTNVFTYTNQTFGVGEIGLRIPFGPVHLTSEVSAFTNFNRTYKLYFRFGISGNIGFNKKFSKPDKENIKLQISKMIN